MKRQRKKERKSYPMRFSLSLLTNIILTHEYITKYFNQ